MLCRYQLELKFILSAPPTVEHIKSHVRGVVIRLVGACPERRRQCASVSEFQGPYGTLQSRRCGCGWLASVNSPRCPRSVRRSPPISWGWASAAAAKRWAMPCAQVCIVMRASSFSRGVGPMQPRAHCQLVWGSRFAADTDVLIGSSPPRGSAGNENGTIRCFAHTMHSAPVMSQPPSLTDSHVAMHDRIRTSIIHTSIWRRRLRDVLLFM